MLDSVDDLTRLRTDTDFLASRKEAKEEKEESKSFGYD